MIKPVCTVMVGLPACGKSTRVGALTAVNPELFVYSTDNHIEQCAKQNGWTYDQAFAEFIESATKHMNQQLDIAIRSRQDVVWDQTNLGAKKRAKTINRMRNAGYRVECECIRPPMTDDEVDEWMNRLVNRPGKTIPPHVMESMMDSYVKPTEDEGFDTVRCYDMYGNCV